MLWGGDNLYFQQQDELDPAAMAMRYQRQRTYPPLQKLLTSAPHLAIWDDHDYGPNDADMSYGMKGDSLQLFRRYWTNPSYGLPDVPGIFGRARWGDVDIFLLDDRWYRSANRAKDGPEKTMFGAKQMAWLRNALIHSQAPIKLVVDGSRMSNRANRFEGWNHFATEQRAFADWLQAQRIDGVVFLSGDRHFGEVLKDETPQGTYPLYEFTSSPLTSRPWVNPDAAEQHNTDVVPGHAARQAAIRNDPRHRAGGRSRACAGKLRRERARGYRGAEIRARDLGPRPDQPATITTLAALPERAGIGPAQPARFRPCSALLRAEGCTQASIARSFSTGRFSTHCRSRKTGASNSSGIRSPSWQRASPIPRRRADRPARCCARRDSATRSGAGCRGGVRQPRLRACGISSAMRTSPSALPPRVSRGTPPRTT